MWLVRKGRRETSDESVGGVSGKERLVVVGEARDALYHVHPTLGRDC
jgi:hypothetical protein